MPKKKKVYTERVTFTTDVAMKKFIQRRCTEELFGETDYMRRLVKEDMDADKRSRHP